MAQAKCLREQRMEMTNTFAAIRQKMQDAQVSIRKHNKKADEFKAKKEEAYERYDEGRAKCTELRNIIAEKERDLADAENQIPLAKSKMYELESMYGENKHFEKVLERTRREVTELEKRRDKVHVLAKEKAEDCWQAKQKMHKLELRVEDVDKKLEFCTRRIIVAREKISAADVQSNSVSMNYQAMSKNEMENKYYEKLQMANQAKERCKVAEEREMKLSWREDELSAALESYRGKMREMFTGQRELGSSKIL